MATTMYRINYAPHPPVVHSSATLTIPDHLFAEKHRKKLNQSARIPNWNVT